nr:hypothetical protein [Tanacetum cinerariifolium]
MYHLMIQKKKFHGTLSNDDDDDDEEEIAKLDEQEATKSGECDAEETESDEESVEEETREEKEESFNPIPRTPKDSKDDGNGEEDHGLRVSEEKRLIEEEEADELYRDSIFTTASSPIAPIQTSTTPIMTPSTIATLTTSSEAPLPLTTIPSAVLQNLLTFDLVFRFEDRVKSLEVNFSDFMQTNQFAEAISKIPGIVHQYMTQQMTEAVRKAVQIQTDRLQDSFQRENDEFLRTIDKNMKKIIKGQVKSQALVDAYEADKTILESYGDTTILKRIRRDDDDQEGPSAGSDRGSKRRRKGGEPEAASTPFEPATRSASRSTTRTQSRPMSASESAFAEEPVQTTCQMDKSPHLPRKPPTPDRDWNKTLPAVQGSVQTWISELAKQADSRSSFNELLDTPIDFSNFIINRLCVDTLTPKLLAGPTYELMRGSCNSLTELEYHLEEVYKVTMDQLDWVNPEGQHYPHNLLQPLLLIPDNRGRRVIPFAHFINNDLEYLRGDLVPRTMWIQEPLNYDKHALWGVSYWGRKRQQFYGFVVNRESALNVYSKRRIIAVTDLKIVEWHNYKHLDWILVRRDDDKIFEFKEGDFKRLRLQDIEDMLLLLVQGKLSNLTVEECFAFNVSLRMFTRSVVIQQRMEDLQLGVESYQKRLNLTKRDTYRSDLKRREAYTTYSNPRGFIYQNKDKKNRLMRIDELQKFSDGTHNDVRNALDDHLKGIRMQYLPQAIWRKGDKDRAAAMIQSIDKMLKTRRIMRSLERFVGGRLDAMHIPSQPLKVKETLFQNSPRFTHFYRLSHSELVGIEKVALSSSL